LASTRSSIDAGIPVGAEELSEPDLRAIRPSVIEPPAAAPANVDPGLLLNKGDRNHCASSRYLMLAQGDNGSMRSRIIWGPGKKPS